MRPFPPVGSAMAFPQTKQFTTVAGLPKIGCSFLHLVQRTFTNFEVVSLSLNILCHFKLLCTDALVLRRGFLADQTGIAKVNLFGLLLARHLPLRDGLTGVPALVAKAPPEPASPHPRLLALCHGMRRSMPSALCFRYLLLSVFLAEFAVALCGLRHLHAAKETAGAL